MNEENRRDEDQPATYPPPPTFSECVSVMEGLGGLRGGGEDQFICDVSADS